MSVIPLPDYAYVPGQNERHPDNAFEALRRTVVPGQDAGQLSRSDAFQAGLQYIRRGYYWEAHEVLEPVWMALPEGSVERRFVQGLIQLANGWLKLLMNRPKATLRLIAKARALFPSRASDATVMTIEVKHVHRCIDALEFEVKLAK